MNIRMKRGMALVLMASLLLAGSAQALFGLGKSKPETVSPENGPTARDLEIRTYRGIPYLGQLEAADPDGGELTFAIVTQPKKGTVTVEGANFTYTPKENAAGGDSFTYSAANSAGAVSLPATVTVTIEKTRSGVTYADTGEATATAAQDLAERGVFTGAKIGDKWYFEPDRTVSRGEFLAMVLETAGAEVTDVTMTGFRDDDAIPTWAKSYAAAGRGGGHPAWKAHGGRGGILLRGAYLLQRSRHGAEPGAGSGGCGIGGMVRGPGGGAFLGGAGCGEHGSTECPQRGQFRK